MFSFAKSGLSILCVCATLAASSSALAATHSGIVTTSPSRVITQRIDVASDVAAQDSTYSIAKAAQYAESEQNAPSARALTWSVWGERRLNSDSTSTPIGYSAHKNGDTVLSTYHYTRTFVGSDWDPRGDSGRQWGSYTVKATGTKIYDDVFDVYTHRVYYGTES